MNSPPPLPPHVFRLLSRQHHAVPWSSARLEAALATVRRDRQDALVELDPQNGPLGRLLFQAGHLVYAQRGEDAAGDYGRGSPRRLRVLGLTTDEAVLACAAVDGTPYPTDDLRGADLGTLLGELARRAFTGVMAVEHGRQLSVLRLLEGLPSTRRVLPEAPRIARLTGIVWQPRALGDLEEFGEPEDRAAVPAAGAGATAADPERAWALFEAVMNAQLGERAARVIATTRASLGDGPSAEVVTSQLARQVERVAGVPAARLFLARCLVPLPDPG